MWLARDAGAQVARFGDNMRYVAVTEGDKVEAQLQFGSRSTGYGVSDLVAAIHAVPDDKVDALVGEYERSYDVAPVLRTGGGGTSPSARQRRSRRACVPSWTPGTSRPSLTRSRTSTAWHNCRAAVQRLMADGYGFAAEGDWKTAALLRIMKVMSEGLPGGTSFMEDYTYHLAPGAEKILGAHMLKFAPRSRRPSRAAKSTRSRSVGSPTLSAWCARQPLGRGWW